MQNAECCDRRYKELLGLRNHHSRLDSVSCGVYHSCRSNGVACRCRLCDEHEDDNRRSKSCTRHRLLEQRMQAFVSSYRGRFFSSPQDRFHNEHCLQMQPAALGILYKCHHSGADGDRRGWLHLSHLGIHGNSRARTSGAFWRIPGTDGQICAAVVVLFGFYCSVRRDIHTEFSREQRVLNRNDRAPLPSCGAYALDHKSYGAFEFPLVSPFANFAPIISRFPVGARYS